MNDVEQRILLLEDDETLNHGITLTLKNAGYHVTPAHTLASAMEHFEREPFSLVISDVLLPDGSGHTLGKKVREKNTLLLYLTALDSEADIVSGYDAGADDYMTKPFSLIVLLTKVRALLRRLPDGGENKSFLVSEDLAIDLKEMRVRRGAKELVLSKKELQLLIYLWENAGQVLSREKILEHIWDVDGQFVDDNTVTVCISRLKNKLQTEAISNVRGLGYLWTGKVTEG
ncbi:MAG: response regulator transcription factor [Muribaculaceae bacterium]|nr:response regulator transcription factor [Roseburia sp.]MCM1430312.1 response regulator transcription factor [Muribaculaceae bacterium]MCM1492492.1 response regulator transcription factor [Muribaculaceae bacterium]